MADEATDSLNSIVICLCSVVEVFTAYEDFVCIGKVESIEANVIVGVLKHK